MNIKVKDCEVEKNAKVIYIYGKQVDNNGTITKVKYYNPSESKNYWVAVSSLSKKLLDGSVFAYAGVYSDSDKSFNNICVVVPMIKDEEYYITSVTDDKKTNNLDKIPIYEK